MFQNLGGPVYSLFSFFLLPSRPHHNAFLNTLTVGTPFPRVAPQNLSYSLHEAGVVGLTTGGIDFIPLTEHLSILGTPVGKCRL